MSARTTYYIKTIVPTVKWFARPGVTGEEAVQELRKTENIISVLRTTCDENEVLNDHDQTS